MVKQKLAVKKEVFQKAAAGRCTPKPVEMPGSALI
jgi:hypothetical protein